MDDMSREAKQKYSIKSVNVGYSIPDLGIELHERRFLPDSFGKSVIQEFGSMTLSLYLSKQWSADIFEFFEARDNVPIKENLTIMEADGMHIVVRIKFPVNDEKYRSKLINFDRMIWKYLALNGSQITRKNEHYENWQKEIPLFAFEMAETFLQNIYLERNQLLKTLVLNPEEEIQLEDEWIKLAEGGADLALVAWGNTQELIQIVFHFDDLVSHLPVERIAVSPFIGISKVDSIKGIVKLRNWNRNVALVSVYICKGQKSQISGVFLSLINLSTQEKIAFETDSCLTRIEQNLTPLGDGELCLLFDPFIIQIRSEVYKEFAKCPPKLMQKSVKEIVSCFLDISSVNIVLQYVGYDGKLGIASNEADFSEMKGSGISFAGRDIISSRVRSIRLFMFSDSFCFLEVVCRESYLEYDDDVVDVFVGHFSRSFLNVNEIVFHWRLLWHGEASSWGEKVLHYHLPRSEESGLLILTGNVNMETKCLTTNVPNEIWKHYGMHDQYQPCQWVFEGVTLENDDSAEIFESLQARPYRHILNFLETHKIQFIQ
jgi:hypothetical protein